MLTLARDRLLENACDSSDVELVNSLLPEGVNPNFVESSRIHPGKAPTESPQVGCKRQLKGLDSEEGSLRRSSRLRSKIRLLILIQLI